MKHFGSLLVAVFLATPAMATDQGSPPPPTDQTPVTQPSAPPGARGPGGNNPQQQQRFAKMKEFRIKGIQGHLNILQQKLTCVQGAQNRDAVRTCEEQAKLSRMTLDQQLKSQAESLRQNKQ
ncbi:MAG: hypothetical protein HQL79_07400 [Magnetococcales bacterium]|nr:hypothetical protein [Magnetococcales bacterium]